MEEWAMGRGAAVPVVNRVTSEVPTRQTLKCGLRVGEVVVARMDRGVATRIGELRARMRQRRAEAIQLEDG